MNSKHLLGILTFLMITAIPGTAQPPAGGRGGRGGPRPAAFPSHPQADQATLDRGRALYGVQCNFCHGSDARGGEGGPNLLRSELVLNDKNGEAIGPVILNGRIDQGMPKFNMNPAQIADIAAFIHNFKVGGYDEARMTPETIVTGDARAGDAAFKSKCASCHSTTGDLKGLASRISDPKQLQQTWLVPGSARAARVSVPPVTVTVTSANGQKTEGRLTRIDDFIVTLTDSEDTQQTFARHGDVPKVDVHDPLKPHKDFLRTYSDTEIHNITAYLVTIK